MELLINGLLTVTQLNKNRDMEGKAVYPILTQARPDLKVLTVCISMLRIYHMTTSIQCKENDLPTFVIPKLDPEKLSAELQNETNRYRQLERKIQDKDAHYHAILEAFDGLMYVGSKDYRIEFMNNQLIKRTGHNGVGDFCFKTLHGRDSICPWCVNERVFNGETVRWDVQSPKDKRWFFNVNAPIFHQNGDISKLAMILDITEQKKAERDSRENEKLYQLTVNNIPDGIFLLQEGKIVFVNDAFLSMFG